jgi:hypothetical protein
MDTRTLSISFLPCFPRRRAGRQRSSRARRCFLGDVLQPEPEPPHARAPHVVGHGRAGELRPRPPWPQPVGMPRTASTERMLGKKFSPTF